MESEKLDYTIKEFSLKTGLSVTNIQWLIRTGKLGAEKKKKTFGMSGCVRYRTREVMCVIPDEKTLRYLAKRAILQDATIPKDGEMRVNDFALYAGYEKTYIHQWCCDNKIDFLKRDIHTKSGIREATFILLTDKTKNFIKDKENKIKTVRVKNSRGLSSFKGDCYIYRADAMGKYLAYYYADLQSEKVKKIVC